MNGDDIANQLREYARVVQLDYYDDGNLLKRAADEIDRLQAQRDASSVLADLGTFMINAIDLDPAVKGNRRMVLGLTSVGYFDGDAVFEAAGRGVKLRLCIVKDDDPTADS